VDEDSSRRFGLPRVVQMFAEGEFRISGRRTEYVKKRS
jgi:hypothetical protein